MKILYKTISGTESELPFSKQENANISTYIVKRSEMCKKNIERITIDFEKFYNPCGNGYMFYPVNCFVGVILTKFRPRANHDFHTHITSMAIAGIGECENACYFHAITMSYDLLFHVGVENNVYFFKPEIILDGDDPEEDLIFEIKKHFCILTFHIWCVTIISNSLETIKLPTEKPFSIPCAILISSNIKNS